MYAFGGVFGEMILESGRDLYQTTVAGFADFRPVFNTGKSNAEGTHTLYNRMALKMGQIRPPGQECRVWVPAGPEGSFFAKENILKNFWGRALQNKIRFYLCARFGKQRENGKRNPHPVLKKVLKNNP